MKHFVAVSLFVLSTASFGQETPEPQKVEVLPEAGDFAVSIDATPFLEYAGKLLSDAGATAPSWNYLTANPSVTGKYFVSPTFAFRGSLRLGFNNTSNSEATRDRSLASAAAFPSQASLLQNSVDLYSTNISVSGGVEWRRGKGNLQGYFGGELGVSVNNSGATYQYGNALTQQASTADVANVDVSTTEDLVAPTNNITVDPYGNPARILTANGGWGFGVGVRAFVGVEYFILPKLSLGGEFGWGVSFVSGGTSSEEIESEGTVNGNQVLARFNRETRNPSSFGFDTENTNSVFGPAGRIKLSFHF